MVRKKQRFIIFKIYSKDISSHSLLSNLILDSIRAYTHSDESVNMSQVTNLIAFVRMPNTAVLVTSREYSNQVRRILKNLCLDEGHRLPIKIIHVAGSKSLCQKALGRLKVTRNPDRKISKKTAEKLILQLIT